MRDRGVSLDLLHLENLDTVLSAVQSEGQILSCARLRPIDSLVCLYIMHLFTSPAWKGCYYAAFLFLLENAICARPATSRMSAARPSPKIVAPKTPSTLR